MSFVMEYRVKKYLLFLGAALAPGVASAQDAGEAALADIIARQDADLAAQDAVPAATVPADADDRAPTITVTANGLGTDIRNTGQAVTIIGQAEIDAVQGADIARVLQRTPGLSLARNGGAGSFTGINIRGGSAEQGLVLVDGVRVADPAAPAGGFDFGNVISPMVGKFDILRGANSTIWGSDAVAGVIDITTRAETGFAGTLEYGARDTLLASAAAGVDGEGVFVGLTGSWFRTDGFSSAAAGSERDGFRQFAIGSSAFIDLTPTIELFGHANVRHSELELDGYQSVAPFAPIDSGDRQETAQHWGDVGLAYYGNDLTLRGAFSLAQTRRDNTDADGQPLFESEGRSHRLQVRGEYRLLGGLALAFGGEHEWTRYDVAGEDAARTEISGAYAQLGWVMGALAIHAGGRVDHHALFGTQTSFGGDASYRLSPSWRLRASVGEGFKAPSLYQLFGFYGNRALEPEESTSIDFGIERGERGRGLHLALTAFRRTSDNLVDFTYTAARPDGFYANTARARAQGIEAEAGVDLAEGLRLSGVYALVDSEDRETGRALARRPRHIATLFADWAVGPDLRLGADLRISSGSFDDAANARRVPGYEVLDLRAALPVTQNLELFGRVENVFDAEYQTAFGYASPGRGVFAGVRARM